jgi:hypothetical protein
MRIHKTASPKHANNGRVLTAEMRVPAVSWRRETAPFALLMKDVSRVEAASIKPAVSRARLFLTVSPTQ